MSQSPALLIQKISGRRTVCVGLWLTHGAAHDPAALAGATHLVEHLTLRRCGDRDRSDLSRLVDRLGGEVDAWTSAESMGLSVRTTGDAIEEALALLVDAILEPTFDAEDVELEKRVTLAELDLIEDDPVEQVEDLILRAAWGDHSLARPVIGSRESVAVLDGERLRQHHQNLIAPGRMLLAAAGDLSYEQVAPLVRRLPLHEPTRFPELPPLSWVGSHLRLARPSVDQVHARLAFPALPVGHPEVTTLLVLNRVLGVGASSRLFQRLREEEGLTYDIWSGLVLRGQGGLMEVGWAAAPGVHQQVHRLVEEELARLLADINSDEVEVAKESLGRALVMDAESTGGACGLDVAEVLERGRRFNLDSALAELAEVSTVGVAAVAEKILRRDQMATALCGPEGVVQQVA